MKHATKKPLACAILFTIVYFAATGLAQATPGKNKYKGEQPVDSKIFFGLHVKNGEKIGNIFTRTVSYKGDSFPEVAYRAGGTGVYTVLDNDPMKPVFDGVFRYDGRPESKCRVEMSDMGKMSGCNSKPSLNTDRSGVVFNSLIWGTPPAKIKKGDTWTVTIPQAWELGGAGTQTVTVLDIDEKNNTVRLKREGNSEGYYDNDPKQIYITREGKNLIVNVTPGSSHWVGYTTFKNGLVISDELMASRPVTLSTDGLKFEGFEREYILLNEMALPNT